MGRPERSEIVGRIEAMRDSRVLVYVTSDRAPAPAQIGDDAVRPMFDHLRSIGHTPKLDLFIYSRGGAIDVPWRIATALRQVSDEWNVLVPFRANSAATLLALGADGIVMGRQGELGPIDPQLSIKRVVPDSGGGQTVVQEQISAEDVLAYTRFVQDRAGLSDQEALSSALSKLTERLDAVVLGNVYRTHTHIRDVAQRMIRSRKEPGSEQDMRVIIETLAERVYAHGHAIGLTEAAAIGLPVTAADDELDAAMWDLLGVYESDLKLLEPLDPVIAVEGTDIYREDATIAIVESTWGAHEFQGQLEVRAQRQMPPNLTVNITLALNIPQGLDPASIPDAIQQSIQQILQQGQAGLLQAANQAVQEALKVQAPLRGYEAGLRNGLWVKSA